MAYTTIKKPSDYFNTVTYSGNGSTQSITGVNFQPDTVWVKARSGTYGTENHFIYDVIRGVNTRLLPNASSAEATDTTGLSSFDSDGFSSGNKTEVNGSGTEYVAWNWLASNTTASNTDGSITSTVSANTTSGFSIVKWTGTSTTGTIGHGLGVAPKVIIVKSLASTEWWYSYWQPLGNNKQVALNSTSAEGTTTLWNNTDPTSSVFSVINHGAVNGSGDYIAYCFAEKQGFSKFGSYTGNGNADGTFVYTGFKPAFVLIKRTDSNNWWHIFDNKRDEFNLTDKVLYPNASNAEATIVLGDILSNGFKLRQTDADVNGSGASYIYMAFAEEPLVGDNPATAR